jgi:competence protein ComEA
MKRALVAAVLAAFAFDAGAAVEANEASQAELETVRGIGPDLSTRILDARRSGRFRDWGDFVARVSGVGTSSAQKLSKAGLTVAGEAFAGPAGAKKAAR